MEVQQQKECTVLTTASVLPGPAPTSAPMVPEAMGGRVRVPILQRVANAEMCID